MLRRKVQVFVYRRNPGLEILLLKRSRPSREGVGDAGDWQPVTGNVDAHEQLRNAAVRECAEEIACELTPEPLGMTFTYAKKGKRFHETIFAGSIPAEEEIEIGEEHTEFAWLSPAAAKERLHWPEQKKALEAVVSRYG